MYSFEEILAEIEKGTKLPKEELTEKIKKKQEELSGLVSLEGAAHLVARDLGVNLLITSKRHFKIKDLKDGIKKMDLTVRIVQISGIKEFERKNKEKGRVCNLILTDGSGDVRLPLWDKQVDIVEEGKIKEGDVIEVKNAFAKENSFSGIEIRLPKLGRIEKINDDQSLPRQVSGGNFKRTPIRKLKEGNYEITGRIVQVFNINPLFQTCPKCGAKIEKAGEDYTCSEHGKVTPDNNMIISGIVDDGTASIRSVFFREQAKNVTGLAPSVLLSMPQDEVMNLIRETTLGNEIMMRGRVQKNKIFDSLEIVVNEVEKLNIEDEIKRLINEVEKDFKVK
jgi:replication factor A1